MGVIKSVTLTVNTFGAVEVVATLEGKKTVGLLVIGTYIDGYMKYTAMGADLKNAAHNLYSSWDFDALTEDPILRRLFYMAHMHYEQDALERRQAEEKAKQAAEYEVVPNE